MKITLKLFANFRSGRFKICEQEVVIAATCADVAASVNISETEIGVVLVNGRHAALSDALRAGDTLALFPLVGGG